MFGTNFKFGIPEIRFLKWIASVIGQSVVFGLLITSGLFVIIYIPEIFNGKFYYFNIFLVAVIGSLGVCAIARIFRNMADLFCRMFYNSPEDCPMNADTKHQHSLVLHSILEADEEFMKFYEKQNQEQDIVLNQIQEIQDQLDELFHVSNNSSSHLSNKVENENLPLDETSSHQVRCASTTRLKTKTKNKYPPNMICHCTAVTRQCRDCQRNPECTCAEDIEHMTRLRCFKLDQHYQIVHQLTQAQIRMKIERMAIEAGKNSASESQSELN